jgi:hydrogenase maturation protease
MRWDVNNELRMKNGELRNRRASPNSKFPNQNSQFLVIGYGSVLHSDDAVGQKVAEAVADWRMPEVSTVAATQLTPDLAERISQVDEVFFVDAAIKPIKPNKPRRCFGLIRLQPAHDAYELGQHFGDPRTLLALAQVLYGRCPRAWLITIPGQNFDLGETLSPETQCGMAQTLDHIRTQIGCMER